ncbi:MAG: mechanosensitive ion channel domain-containing protein [Candidatus Woesearchaeota archaeon]
MIPRLEEVVTPDVANPIEIFSNIFNDVMINILVALLIFFIGFIFGRLLGRIIKKVLRHMNTDYFMRNTLGIKMSAEDILSVSASYFVYVISFVMALNQLGLSTAILQMVIGGVIAIIVISIILSIKDFLPNMVAGLLIKEKSFIAEGDVIKIRDVEGKVDELGLVETVILNRHGDRIFIPNIVFTKNEVINYKPKAKKKSESKS